MNWASASHPRPFWANRHILFAALVGTSAAVFSRSLWLLGSRALHNDEYSHILVVPLLSAWFVRERYREALAQATYDVGAGLPLIFAGMATYALSCMLPLLRDANDVLTVSVAGVVLAWIGAAVACYGRSACRTLAFPVLLLFLMVPLPGAVVHWIVFGLQQLSATASELLFLALRVPVLRQGTVMALPGATIEVAEACSGIRSSIAMLITFLIVAKVALQRARYRVLLLLLTIPVSILKNAVRIVTLSLLAIRVDPSFLTGNLHHDGGIVFYLIGLALMLPVVRLLQRLERRYDRTVAPAVDG